MRQSSLSYSLRFFVRSKQVPWLDAYQRLFSLPSNPQVRPETHSATYRRGCTTEEDEGGQSTTGQHFSHRVLQLEPAQATSNTRSEIATHRGPNTFILGSVSTIQ